jgi:hypothetical protein
MIYEQLRIHSLSSLCPVNLHRRLRAGLTVVVPGSGKAAAINAAAAVCSTSPNRRRIYRYGATD